MTKHCSRKSWVRRFVLPAALTFLLASCHPLAPVMYIGISLCLLSKTTPPSTFATENNTSVAVGNAVFTLKKSGVKYLAESQACFIALEVETKGVPPRLDLDPRKVSKTPAERARFNEIYGLYQKAAVKFVQNGAFGCKVARIAVNGPLVSDASNSLREGSIDQLIDENGKLSNPKTSHC